MPVAASASLPTLALHAQRPNLSPRGWAFFVLGSASERPAVNHVDITIIGQGLAGTALAWELLRRGKLIAIIDPGESASCSRVAAGLVTPLTGGRASLTWRWHEIWESAQAHYGALEHRLDAQFWHVAPSIRLYQSAEQRADFAQRFKAWPEIATGSVDHCSVGGGGGVIAAQFGAFSMMPAARLDTARYLDVSRSYFQEHARVIEAEFAWTEIAETGGSISLPAHGLTTTHIVSCQGVAARRSGPFTRLNLHPARGDILTISSDKLHLTHVLHGDAWIIPENTQPATYLVGATYDRHNFECGDQAGARAELERRLRSFVTVDYQVLAQRAGIRPASFDKKPLMGRHPDHDHLWLLNGLGSKGASLAPWCARQLADAMLNGHPVDPALDWTRRLAPT